jgi:hypothetical protein
MNGCVLLLRLEMAHGVMRNLVRKHRCELVGDEAQHGRGDRDVRAEVLLSAR